MLSADADSMAAYCHMAIYCQRPLLSRGDVDSRVRALCSASAGALLVTLFQAGVPWCLFAIRGGERRPSGCGLMNVTNFSARRLRLRQAWALLWLPVRELFISPMAGEKIG